MNPRIVVMVMLPLLLGGCKWQTLPTAGGTIAGRECRVIERPPYAVAGRTSYDQNWIDSTIEGAVGACGMQRPSPRPAELDALPGQKAVAPPPKPRRGLVKRIRDRILPPKPAEKSTWPPVADPIAPAPVEPPPPPKPRSAIDELLHPSR